MTSSQALFLLSTSGLCKNFCIFLHFSDRLEEIRAQKMYPFFDKGGNNGNGDFQLNIRDTSPLLNKQLNFLLPFMGFGFNYTWLSLHG